MATEEGASAARVDVVLALLKNKSGTRVESRDPEEVLRTTVSTTDWTWNKAWVAPDGKTLYVWTTNKFGEPHHEEVVGTLPGLEDSAEKYKDRPEFERFALVYLDALDEGWMSLVIDAVYDLGVVARSEERARRLAEKVPFIDMTFSNPGILPWTGKVDSFIRFGTKGRQYGSDFGETTVSEESDLAERVIRDSHYQVSSPENVDVFKSGLYDPEKDALYYWTSEGFHAEVALIIPELRSLFPELDELADQSVYTVSEYVMRCLEEAGFVALRYDTIGGEAYMGFSGGSPALVRSLLHRLPLDIDVIEVDTADGKHWDGPARTFLLSRPIGESLGEGFTSLFFQDLKRIYISHSRGEEPDALALQRVAEILVPFMEKEVEYTRRVAHGEFGSPDWMISTALEVLPPYEEVLKLLTSAKTSRERSIAIDQAIGLHHILGGVLDSIWIDSSEEMKVVFSDLMDFLRSIGRFPERIDLSKFDLQSEEGIEAYRRELKRVRDATWRVESLSEAVLSRGQCYRNAWVYATKEASKDVLIVHGEVTNLEGKTFNHAWVEEGGRVIDPTQGVTLDKDRYYALSHAKVQHKYTTMQVNLHMLRTGNYGPWTEGEVGNRFVESLNEDTQVNLDPDFFDRENRLREDIREVLMRVVSDVLEGIDEKGFHLDPAFIVLTGSLCGPDWDAYSDIDLHIGVDFSQYEEPGLIKGFLSYFARDFNSREYNLVNRKIELYFQDVVEPHDAPGVYDIANDHWLQVPDGIRIEVTDEARRAAESYKVQVEELVSTYASWADPPEVFMVQLKAFWQGIREMRKQGLEQAGRGSFGNQTFKLMRRNSSLATLVKLIRQVQDDIYEVDRNEQTSRD